MLSNIVNDGLSSILYRKPLKSSEKYNVEVIDIVRRNKYVMINRVTHLSTTVRHEMTESRIWQTKNRHL